MNGRASTFRTPVRRARWLKRRCYGRFFFVILALLVLYQIAVVVTERDRLAQLRALECAYRKLGMSERGVPDFEGGWMAVAGTEDKVFTYSAYLDPRDVDTPQVRVIVLAPLEGEINVECSFWTQSNQTTSVIGELTIFPEHHDRPLSTGAINCPLADFFLMTSSFRSKEANCSETISFNEKEEFLHQTGEPFREAKLDPVVRVAVSAVAGMSNKYSASIPVDVLVNRRKRGELNVCVKQLHSNYNRAAALVEFIELQRILGADHFTFYNLSIGPDVEAVLHHYVKEGLVEVLPFSAPDPSTTDNIDRVTLASLNDCVLRSVGRYPLVAVVDPDEIIVPRKVDDNLQMVQQLGHYAEYGVQNAFFYLFYGDDTDNSKEFAGMPDSLSPEDGLELLLTQRKTRRVEQPNDHKVRSKYLCRPEEVLIAGIHSVHQFIEGGGVLQVDPSTALSHHYRGGCEEGEENASLCYLKPTVVDRTALRFKNPLINAVIHSCQAIFPARRLCLPLFGHTL